MNKSINITWTKPISTKITSFTINQKMKKYSENNNCNICKIKLNCFENVRFDHILPVTFGGESNIENGQILCKKCYHKKHTIDRILIKCLKELNFMKGYHYYVSKEKIKDFYNQNYKDVLKLTQRTHLANNGELILIGGVDNVSRC